jgi:hypothetical protein
MDITDKDVQEISDYLYNHGNLPGDMQPKILSGLKECLTLREQKRKLIADGVRLVTLVRLAGYTWIANGTKSIVTEIIDQHDILMKELEE